MMCKDDGALQAGRVALLRWAEDRVARGLLGAHVPQRLREHYAKPQEYDEPISLGAHEVSLSSLGITVRLVIEACTTCRGTGETAVCITCHDCTGHGVRAEVTP